MATSIYRGVYWDKEKAMWRVEIEVSTARYKLGRFHDETLAARAYDIAAAKLGVPERCNQIRDDLRKGFFDPCAYCKGSGLVGGEFKRVQRGSVYVAGFSRLRECRVCKGAGYVEPRKSYFKGDYGHDRSCAAN